jgi:phage baseplate assembly protein W
MIDAGQLLGRGIAFPPRLGADGRVAFSEGDENIRDSIRVILQTDRGERLRLGQFGAGLNRMLFEPNVVATHRQLQERIVNALAAWEPRIAVEAVTVEPDPRDAGAAIATIHYTLVATQAGGQLTVGLELGS